MTVFLLKRLLLFVPTLLAVSLIAFGLSRLTPGDPVLHYLVTNPFETAISTPQALLQAEKHYRQAAGTLGQDKPAFYLSVKAKAWPDTLHRIVPRDRRETLEKLIARYGNWEQIEAWHQELRQLQLKSLALPDSLDASLVAFKVPLLELAAAWREAHIASLLSEMQIALDEAPALAQALEPDFSRLKLQFEAVRGLATPALLKIPSLRWYGTDNQYHHWLLSFLRGDLGVSLYDRRPVADKVAPALFWTLVLNLSSLILAFLLAVPLGVWSAARQGKRFDQLTSLGLFMLYSLPAFWIGTLLLIFFTTREYGMSIFPGPGLGYLPAGLPWWEQISRAAPHLVLPVICLTYPAMAYIARQARGGMAEVLRQDFIRTARAKGLPERLVIWRHGFRNALFPLITMAAGVFPGMVAGSVTIEFIFNIPGMGWLSYHAIFSKDWPVVFSVLMLGGVLTITGLLIADVLYALADPRVKLDKA
jgi:peptide/nickel transport system permease protein